MYRTIKRAFVVFCACALLLTFVFYIRQEDPSVNRIALLTPEAYAALVGAQTETSDEPFRGECRIEDTAVPYDEKSRTYYVPQSMETAVYDGDLTWVNPLRKAYFCPDGLYADKLSAIAAGHAFRLIVTNGSTYFYVNLIFTGLPIVALRYNDAAHETNSPTTYAAELRLLDPGLADPGRFTVTESVVTFRTRGQTSRYYLKKSYRVTCYQRNGKRTRPSFLDLGGTDEWVLLSLYKDPTRVRDMVGQNLWNALCETNPAADIPTDRMRFVELFIDDNYEGLYGLVLPMAAPENIPDNCKTLYKNEYSVFPDDLGRWKQDLPNFPDVAEIKWPQNAADPALWEPLRQYFTAFLTVPRAASYETLAGMLDLSNTVDFALFLQAAAGSDQLFRNNYYTLLDDGTFLKTPFDLTTTFGYALYDEPTIHSGGLLMEHATKDFLYFDTRVLIDANPQAVVPSMLARWNELKKTLFSAESLKNAFAEQMAVLTKSGAFDRDAVRWTEFPVSSDLTKVNEFIDLRAAYMERYMAALSDRLS